MRIGNFQSIRFSQKQTTSPFLHAYSWVLTRVNQLFLLKIEINDEFFGIISRRCHFFRAMRLT